MMTGSQFAARWTKKNPYAWETEALELAKQGGLTPWPWVPIQLTSDDGHTATIHVRSDVLSIGPTEDHLRLPLSPRTAQSIANLDGSLLPTPWIVYQTWCQAPLKLRPTPITVLGEANNFVDMRQYDKHSRAIDGQIAQAGAPFGVLTSGQKKDVVVSNIYRPGYVLIFGWYYPDRGDVFDDKKPWEAEDRQPRQVRSNVHVEGYWDYSHGIRLVHPIAYVDGQPMRTVDLYQHPTLSKLVSNEGPVRVPRYPASVPPAEVVPPAPGPGPGPVITSDENGEPLEGAADGRFLYRAPGLLIIPSIPRHGVADLGLRTAARLARKPPS